MGRYYSGDIEGKFWFGVQASDDADFFGGHQSEPGYINYFFSEDDVPSVEAGISKCREALGDYESQLRDFFAKAGSYTDKMVALALGLPWTSEDSFDFDPQSKVKELLEWHARLGLGEKILACVKEKGECSFQAEL